MSKLDFKGISDEELLKMEELADTKIGKSISKFMYNDKLLEMMEELEDIKKEKRHRELNG